MTSADFEVLTALLLKIQVFCDVYGVFIYKFRKSETLLGLLDPKYRATIFSSKLCNYFTSRHGVTFQKARILRMPAVRRSNIITLRLFYHRY